MQAVTTMVSEPVEIIPAGRQSGVNDCRLAASRDILGVLATRAATISGGARPAAEDVVTRSRILESKLDVAVKSIRPVHGVGDRLRSGGLELRGAGRRIANSESGTRAADVHGEVRRRRDETRARDRGVLHSGTCI